MWVSFNVYYYQSNKDGILLDGIYPIVSQLKRNKSIEYFYFDRHWLGGPHLNLNFKCSSDERIPEIKDFIINEIQTYLKKFPSDSVEIDILKRNMSDLEKIEMIETKDSHIHPNNTVRQGEYNSNSSLGIKGKEFTESYLTQSSELIFDLLKKTRNNTSDRYKYSMNLMVIFLNVIGDPKRTYLSLRSHSESILHAYDTTGKVRRKFEQNYNRNKMVIKELIHEQQQGIYIEDFLKWKQLYEETFSRVTTQVDEGTLEPLNVEKAEENFHKNGVPNKWIVNELSDFHELFYSQQGVDDLINSVYFKSIRLMFNQLYRNFKQIGMSTLDRIYLCYLIATGIEEYFGIHWKTQILKTKKDGTTK